MTVLTKEEAELLRTDSIKKLENGIKEYQKLLEGFQQSGVVREHFKSYRVQFSIWKAEKSIQKLKEALTLLKPEVENGEKFAERWYKAWKLANSQSSQWSKKRQEFAEECFKAGYLRAAYSTGYLKKSPTEEELERLKRERQSLVNKLEVLKEQKKMIMEAD